MKTMMKKVPNILVLFTILLSPGMFAQSYMPLPDSAAVWVVRDASSEYWLFNKYFYPAVNRDTVINGLVYHKIMVTSVGIDHPWPNPGEPYFWGPSYFGACRSDDTGRSYLIRDVGNFANQELLYMDLTLQKGDTIRQLPTSLAGIMDEYIFSDFVVDSTDHVESGSVLRKRIILRNLDPPNGMYCNFVWVEGIGNIASGLLNTVGCGLTNVDLECMSISDSILADYLEVYQVPLTGVCNLPYTNNIKHLPINIKVKTYPNPASEYVVFELKQPLPSGTITITDLMGRTVATMPVSGEKTVWVTEGVKAGVYFYNLQNPDGEVSGKLLLSP